MSSTMRETCPHSGSRVSRTIRKRIDESFAWIKTIAGHRLTKMEVNLEAYRDCQA
jgi:hypothetical protein